MVDILIVDDEKDIRDLIYDVLSDEKLSVNTVSSSKEALDYLQNHPQPKAIILDIWLEGSDFNGISILKYIKNHFPLIPVIMISGHGNIATAINCIKIGAYDFIEKPFKASQLILLAKRALNIYALAVENNSLKNNYALEYNLIGTSKAISSVKSAAVMAAPGNSRIMIIGESGSGKETLARFIHYNSNRSNKAFIKINPANMSAEQFEKELFGCNKDNVIGIINRLSNGILFINDFSQMIRETQDKLLDFLQKQDNHKHDDIRIITASSKDLSDMLTSEHINKSLYYRLSVVPLHMPPLKERKEDIKQLAKFFNKHFADKMKINPLNIAEDTYTVLISYDWPGNIRQLKNIIEWLAIMAFDKEVINPDDLPEDIIQSINDKHKDWNPLSSKMISQKLKNARETFEKEYILAQINRFSGNISRTANFIGMDRSSLHRKMKALGIE